MQLSIKTERYSPAGVELTEYLVKNGDIVHEGDPVARVDRISVMSAITEVQERINELDEKIEKAADGEAAESLTAQTYKLVWAEEGDDVRAVMREHGALAVLSLDGRMAISFANGASVRGGQAVTVTLSDDTELDGRVESALDGVVTVTMTDDGPAVGEHVRVSDEDGRLLGEGEITVNEPDTAEDVLTIPAAALNDDGTRSFVYTGYDADKGVLMAPVYVTCGLSDGDPMCIWCYGLEP